MKSAIKILAVAGIVLAASAAQVPGVKLSWDPSPDQIELTYALYGGTNSMDYHKRIAVGTNLTAVVSGLDVGRWYFVCVAVTYEGVESPPSNEVDFQIPSSPLNLSVKLTPQKMTRSVMAK